MHKDSFFILFEQKYSNKNTTIPDLLCYLGSLVSKEI